MPIATKSLALGMLISAATLTPEGRRAAIKMGTAGARIGNTILRNKLGIDADGIMAAINEPIKKKEEEVISDDE